MRKLIQDIGFALDLPKNGSALCLRDKDATGNSLRADSQSVTAEQLLDDPLGLDLDIVEPYSLEALDLLNDNLGTTQTINNPDSTSQRSRHIDTRYFRIRQYVKSLQLRVSYVSTAHNVADFFTKALTFQPFDKFRNIIGLIRLDLPLAIVSS